MAKKSIQSGSDVAVRVSLGTVKAKVLSVLPTKKYAPKEYEGTVVAHCGGLVDHIAIGQVIHFSSKQIDGVM